MEAVDINALADKLRQQCRERTEHNFALGDTLLAMRDADPAGGRDWRGAMNGLFGDELGGLTPAEVGLFAKAAETYGPNERAYSLPWPSYAYALQHTSDPHGWIRKAKDERLTYRQMQKQISEARRKARPVRSDEKLPPIRILSEVMAGRERRRLGIIQLYADIDLDVPPRVVMSVDGGHPLCPDEFDAVHQAVHRVAKEIAVFLDAADQTGVSEAAPAT